MSLFFYLLFFFFLGLPLSLMILICSSKRIWVAHFLVSGSVLASFRFFLAFTSAMFSFRVFMCGQPKNIVFIAWNMISPPATRIKP